MTPPNEEADESAEPGSDAGTPRWVYAFALVGLFIVIGFIVMHLMGGGLRHDMRL